MDTECQSYIKPIHTVFALFHFRFFSRTNQTKLIEKMRTRYSISKVDKKRSLVTSHFCTCVDTVINIIYHVSPSNNMYNGNKVHYYQSNKTQHELGFMLGFISL